MSEPKPAWGAEAGGATMPTDRIRGAFLAHWKMSHPNAVCAPGRWGDVWTDGDSSFLPARHPEAVAADALLYGCCVLTDDLTRDEYTAVLLAVIDAEPDGEAAQREAAVQTCHGLAVAGGWEDEFGWDV